MYKLFRKLKQRPSDNFMNVNQEEEIIRRKYQIIMSNIIGRYENVEFDLKRDFLEGLLVIYKKQLQASLVATFIEQPKPEEVCYFFPLSYIDKKGNVHLSAQENGDTILNLNDPGIITLPTSEVKFARQIRRGRSEKFEYQPLNHFVNYYSPLGLSEIHNGIHSGTQGILGGVGQIKASSFDVSKMMKHVKTDGVTWKSIHNNTELGRVYEYRMAIIFELCKMINKI